MLNQNREQYENHWNNAKNLRLLTAPTVSGDTVVAEIEYTIASRGHVRETHRHTMVTQDGTALINSDAGKS